MAQSDAATLALLQRICLFRLGVDVGTLAAIFTSKNKVHISGPSLACLDEAQLRSKMDLLAEMRLIERQEKQAESTAAQTGAASCSARRARDHALYTVHPAVRDGFLRKLDAETARLGHEAVRSGLEASLGAQRRDNPSSPAMLDLLEEIIFHTLAAGHVQEAWNIFWNRTGHYGNIGRCLGEPERGRRLCGYFLTANRESNLTGIVQQSYLFNNAGLFCRDLGLLAEAREFYEKSVTLRRRSGQAMALGLRNMAHINLLIGRLPAALEHADAALQEARSQSDKTLALALMSQATFLMGDTAFATSEFSGKNADGWPTDASGRPMFYPALWKAWATYRIGRRDQARESLRGLLAATRRHGHALDEMRISLFLAETLIQEGDVSGARGLLDSVDRWALNGGEKELLCWSALIRSRIELANVRRSSPPDPDAECKGLGNALAAADDGLRVAHECGYGIHHIHLRLVRAQIALHEGRASDAERDARVALEEGVHRPPETGLPELLAATNPECQYAWGIAEAGHVLAESLLLQTAQKLGLSDLAPRRIQQLPSETLAVIEQARQHLDQALELWQKLRDPASGADVNSAGERTKLMRQQLSGGILSEYPLEPTRLGTHAKAGKVPRADRGAPAMSQGHVFLSYCRENKTEVSRLRDNLIEAGEQVWWDQDILPGQDWKHEIRKAMRAAYAVVLCLSRETSSRITTGIYPEVLDAIGAYREYAPGSIFLIPVRISECEMPPIEIDATRTLDRLQYVDLFPESRRAFGLEQLIKALKTTPRHP